MSRTSAHVRRLVGAGLAVGLGAAALVIGTASVASANNRPAVTVTGTVSDDTAQVIAAVNRGTQQLRSASCTLDGVAIDCGAPTGNGKKSATFTASLTGLATGEHIVVVTVRLTDGGTASGSTTLEASGPPAPPTFDQVCAGAGGSVSQHLMGPICSAGDVAGLGDACGRAAGEYQAIQAWCIRQEGLAMRQVCSSSVVSTPTYTRFLHDQFDCVTKNEDAIYGQQIHTICDQIGGTFSATTTTDFPDLGLAQQYTCGV